MLGRNAVQGPLFTDFLNAVGLDCQDGGSLNYGSVDVTDLDNDN